jgi:hypothetical protein
MTKQVIYWYCWVCFRRVREDNAHREWEKDVVYVYCPNCGAGLGCWMGRAARMGARADEIYSKRK